MLFPIYATLTMSLTQEKKEYCLKLVTDLGPGAPAYFLQSALIQINYKYPLVHLSYKICQGKQKTKSNKDRRMPSEFHGGGSFIAFP